MDPLISICSHPVTIDTIISLQYFNSSLDRMTDKYVPTPIESVVPTELTHIDNKLYTVLRDIVDGIKIPILNNRAENKLRNLLAACPNLRSKEFRSEWTVEEMLIEPNLDWKIIDIASGPGSWSSILLNRYSSCSVTGYTLAHTNPAFRWYPFLLPNPRFTGIYGDVIQDSINPSQRSRLIPNQEFDLCLCDGGTDIEGIDDLEVRMIDKLRLLAAEFITCLRVGKIGSHAVIKLFKIGIINTQHLINLMACAYENCSIIKLITSRSMSSEHYLICLNRRSNVESVIERMEPYLTITERPIVLLDPIVREYIERVCSMRTVNTDQAYNHAIRLHRILESLDQESHSDYYQYLKKIRKTREWTIPSHKNVDVATLKTLLKIYS